MLSIFSTLNSPSLSHLLHLLTHLSDTFHSWHGQSAISDSGHSKQAYLLTHTHTHTHTQPNINHFFLFERICNILQYEDQHSCLSWIIWFMTNKKPVVPSDLQSPTIHVHAYMRSVTFTLCLSYAAACPVAYFNKRSHHEADSVHAVTTAHLTMGRVTGRDKGHGQSTTALGKDR